MVQVPEPGLSVRLLQPFFRPYLERLGPEEQKAARHEMGRRIDNDEARIPHGLAMRWLAQGVASSGDPALALHAATHYRDGDFDLFSGVVRSSGDLRQAIEAANSHVRLLHDAAELVLDEEGSNAVLRFGFHPSLPFPPACAEFVAGLLARFLRMCGASLSEVWFRHARPAHAAAYAPVLRAPVRFEAPVDALLFPRADLARPFRSGDAVLNRVIRRQASLAMDRIPRVQTLRDQVYELVVAGMRKGNANLGWVAKQLRVSPRTLRRRLGQEGISYQEVRDEARRTLALYHLETLETPIEEISYLLGFTRTTSFYRAFRRWTGTTPSSYRRKERLAS